MTERRVLVTGATGFIGRRTLGALVEQGFEVHGVARSLPSSGPDGVLWHQADLLAQEQRRALTDEVGASHLLHLAWYAEPGKFWTAPENADWVAATVDLVSRFVRAGGTRVVAGGTCAEYDWAAIDGSLAETAPLVPHTFYGVCKDATRRVCEGLAGQSGASVAWGRVFFLYGPEEDPRRLVASVARSLARDERAATSEGRQVRDFLHVDDVAGAFVALLASEVEGAVNLGSGVGVTIREVVDLIGGAAGRPDLLDIGALPTRAGDPPVLVPDVSRLREEVRFVPAISLEDGVAQTVKWWQTTSH